MLKKCGNTKSTSNPVVNIRKGGSTVRSSVYCIIDHRRFLTHSLRIFNADGDGFFLRVDSHQTLVFPFTSHFLLNFIKFFKVVFMVPSPGWYRNMQRNCNRERLVWTYVCHRGEAFNSLKPDKKKILNQVSGDNHGLRCLGSHQRIDKNSFYPEQALRLPVDYQYSML